MLSIVKIALIGTSIFGTTNSIIVKPPVIRNVEKVVQYTNTTISVKDYFGE